MSISADQAEVAIRERVTVTSQRIVIAKAIVLEASTNDSRTDSLVKAVLDANGVELPHQVVLHPSVDPMPSIIAVADALTWQLAAAEAVWSLIHMGLLFSLSEPHGSAPSVQWTTVVPGSGGMSSGWRFEDYYIPLPGRVRRAPSHVGSTGLFLSDPDLYLNSLGIPEMHADVSSAFQEAVKCFRHELFTAAVTMLGKASEGAWLELATALLDAVPPGQESTFARQKTVLEDPMVGTFKKIEAVLAIYDRQDIFRPVATGSGVRPQELRSVVVWSDAVRDSRNTIHFGVTSSTPNTYEKLAALLIGAVPNVRILYRVKQIADIESAAVTS